MTHGYWLLQHEFQRETASKYKTSDERNRRWYHNIIDGLTVMMSNAHGRKHMRTWITAFETPVHWDLNLGGSYQMQYNKLLEQQTNSANPIPAGSGVGIASRFTRSFSEVRNRWKDDDAFRRLIIYRFTVNKMILKYQSGRNIELTNDMMKRASVEGIVRCTAYPNQMIFYARSMSTW